MYDFEVAKDKVLMGAERKSMLLTDEEKRVTAYHEAGHALVAAKREHADPLHKVTIIPRGMALGVTMQLPEDDKHTVTKDYLETQLAILMGGRCAEEIFLKQMTTGAGNDIERATELARKMVCEYGMSRLGPLTFGKKEEQIFLGREIAQHRDYSEETARQIDSEVRSFVDAGYQSAYRILDQNGPDHAPHGDGSAGARDDRRERDQDADRGERAAAAQSAVEWLGQRRSRGEGAEAGAGSCAGLSGRQPLACIVFPPEQPYGRPHRRPSLLHACFCTVATLRK